MFKKRQSRTSTFLKAIFNSNNGTAHQRLNESRQALMAQFPIDTNTQRQRVDDNKG